MTGLLAYVACSLALTALVCGHHGQDWPLAGARRRLCARLATEQAADAPPEPRTAHSAPEVPPRPAPSWARTDHHDLEEAA